MEALNHYPNDHCSTPAGYALMIKQSGASLVEVCESLDDDERLVRHYRK
jgi:hypothetical protein